MSEPGKPLDEDLIVAGLIHELRQPLLGLKAGIQMLAHLRGETLTATDEWQLVTAQLARMEELLKTYQLLFRRESSSEVLYEVEPVVRRAIDLLAYRLGNLAFAYAPPTACVLGRGVPQALFHAVTNLIVNAADAVESAGPARRIEVRIVPPAEGDRFIEVRVSDGGGGISREDRERLFVPRFTTKPAGRGTGLGLHISREALTSSGGDLRLALEDDALRAPWASTEFVARVLSGAAK